MDYSIEDYKKHIKAPTMAQLLSDDARGYQSTIDQMILQKFREVAAANPDAKQILYSCRYEAETDSHFIDFLPTPQTPPPFSDLAPAPDTPPFPAPLP